MAQAIFEEINNPQSVGSKMAVLYAEQTMLDRLSDITLIVGPKKYRLHKNILSASSQTFHDIFEFADHNTEPIPLTETEECAQVFEEFVKYIYTGYICLNLDTVNAIITLAKKYLVEDLFQIAEEFQKKHQPGQLSLSSQHAFFF